MQTFGYFKNMLKKIFDTTFYVQIWENRLKVTNISTGAVFDEKPIMAITINRKGYKLIEAFGNAASFANGDSVKIINPFSHERSLFSNFEIGEKLLQAILQKLSSKSIFRPRPKVVIHPMEKIEGGLTDIETRAFKELAIGAGARDAIVYTGSELPIIGFDFDSIKSRINNSVAR